MCDEPPESAACSTIATRCPRRRPALHISNVIETTHNGGRIYEKFV
jgi:hypothetical protein